MEYIRELPDKPGKPASAALGLFDGLHLGHRAVIGAAAAQGLRTAVFTFSFDRPELVTKPDFAAILSDTRRAEVFARLGVELLCEPPFSAVHDLSPREFVTDVLVARLGVRAIACGEDFRFGKGAAGDAELLSALCRELGLRLTVVPPVLRDGAPVSSTRIRALLREGRMPEAAALLGEPYTIDFPVAHGRQLGRRMGYPTINQIFPAGMLLPKFGVYAAVAEVDGKHFPAVTNIGVKPTLGGVDAPSAETTILGFEGDLYGRRVPVQLISFLRPEQRFDSVESLFAQVARDAGRAEKVARAAMLDNEAGECYNNR